MFVLDDIVVYSATYEEHIQKLENVFQRLRDRGLKLKPIKCLLFQHRIKYLGHVISPEGVSTDPDKISVVKNWPVPATAEELQSFLGFVGFYRCFIRSFSKVARPLQEALQRTGIQTAREGRHKRATPLEWVPEQQEAFDKLVDLCITAPVLAFVDFKEPFKLYIDASAEGLGVVLYQEQDGKERVVAFASRRLSKSEKNYPVHKQEFLALK